MGTKGDKWGQMGQKGTKRDKSGHLAISPPFGDIAPFDDNDPKTQKALERLSAE
jgi:hypothetical protein